MAPSPRSVPSAVHAAETTGPGPVAARWPSLSWTDRPRAFSTTCRAGPVAGVVAEPEAGAAAGATGWTAADAAVTGNVAMPRASRVAVPAATARQRCLVNI